MLAENQAKIARKVDTITFVRPCVRGRFSYAGKTYPDNLISQENLLRQNTAIPRREEKNRVFSRESLHYRAFRGIVGGWSVRDYFHIACENR